MTRLTTEQFIQQKQAEFETERVSATAGKPRRLRFKDIGRAGFHFWVREAWTLMPQSDLPEDKVFVIERFRYEGAEGMPHFRGAAGSSEYRFGYFIRRPNGAWIWGQYCPLVPVGDWPRLLAKAVREGTLQQPD